MGIGNIHRFDFLHVVCSAIKTVAGWLKQPLPMNSKFSKHLKVLRICIFLFWLPTLVLLWHLISLSPETRTSPEQIEWHNKGRVLYVNRAELIWTEVLFWISFAMTLIVVVPSAVRHHLDVTRETREYDAKKNSG